MEALTRSPSKLLTENKPLSSPRALSTKPEIRFFPHQKPNNNVDSSYSMSLQFKPIISIPCTSSFFSPLQVENVGIGQALTEEAGQSKTVHVKLEVKKECAFGQQLFIVGNKPMVGLWDPTLAIPLDWSEGHVWTVELDIPVGNTIHFKFILKGTEMDVVWQPGPDRILQTWETNNTIVVFEDWDSAEIQKIIEAQDTSGDPEEENSTNNGLTIADKIASLEEKPSTNVNKEVIGAADETNSEEEGHENKFGNDGIAVLVPGLTPSPPLNAEEENKTNDVIDT